MPEEGWRVFVGSGAAAVSGDGEVWARGGCE